MAESRSPEASGPSTPPRVWLLTAYRAGDNTQVLALGEALGWPFEVKRFVYVRWEVLVNWPFSSTLAGVDLSRSSPLGPPWPDLVITAGRRNEPIARWIRRSADRRVRLVHVGRPWARPSRWDLVVTTPQYRVPDAPNVLQNEAPLHRVTPERLAKEAAAWAPRFASLPRPLIAVLAGGNSGPYPFDARSGWRLGRRASALARELGGSLLVTTSARTLPETVEALVAAIDVPHFLYRWAPDDPENPYFGILANADRIIATADSVSMMAEACATGRPVHLYDTGEGITSMREDGPHGPGSGWQLFDRNHRKAFVYYQTMRHGPERLTRDIRIVQQRLVESGRASWLGDEAPEGSPPPLRDLDRAVARVRALFDR
ncbi:MAG TPA: mitochondrial fission ELM1 family protein [Myxococcota bacterium]|nr:mitochondrial fission ELM1 family protein [Myxococcota bacterium]